MATAREIAEQLSRITSGYINSIVLMTANELGVFAHLEEPATAGEVAAKCELDPRGSRMLLDGLVAIELINKSDGRYQNTTEASTCLVPGRPGYQGHIIRHSQHGLPNWIRMAESIKSGEAIAKDKPERSPEELRDFIMGMNDIAQFSAQQVLEAVDLSPYKHLLDLGGGPATYPLTCLQAHPEMRATLFDFPPVIAIGKDQVAQAGLTDRFDFVEGDMTTDPLGTGYDCILLSNIIHSFGPDTNQTVIHKCFQALDPGGRLIIKDFLVENDRSGPEFSLLFALRMLIASGVGDTYTFEEVARWTRNAGFPDGEIISITPQTRLWIVDKP